MSATEFTIDHRDISFVLFEQLCIQEEFKDIERFQEFDQELYQTLVDEAGKLATDVYAPLNKLGDETGCTLDDAGNVTAPEGFREAFHALGEGGWIGLTASPEHGGTGAPAAIGVCLGELMLGANSALTMFSGLTRGVANLLVRFGSDALKELAVEKLYSGQWGGTMCLTESGAGTDVGENRCKATRTDEPGVYHLEGEKIFITCADHDFTENILHLVLARTPDAPKGTKGLSLFLAPKFNFEDGSRNGAFVVGIEEKMGIHASPTCTLSLGADGPCRAHLIANEGDGMQIMFTLMNEARIGVGIQGLANASAAYLNALSYAKDRIQGAKVENWKDANAPRGAIVEHPDVRRMLLWMKSHTEAMRSLLYTMAARYDLSEYADDEERAAHNTRLLELLTPICKAHCTDTGFQVTVTALQTFGGAGYIREYPVEQHLRDNKIASIYEGTNGVQAMDLLGRKMRLEGGQIFMHWMEDINKEIEKARGLGFDDEIATLEKARDALAAAAMHLGGLGMAGNLDGALVYATSFLTLFGTVVLGQHSLQQARVATQAMTANNDLSESDRRFYQGKVLNLKFYAANVLPGAIALSKTIRSGDETPMDDALFG
ncbi:MAG: acyl-CoA dehydrogenase [Myxococcota bacterium]|nr:acyl-CoA dehydrogenase [Myxococcota bacterium]